MGPEALALGVITLGAAIVNGALGYGFSSITVPLALLFLTNRVLNPALVPIEVVLNAYVLWVNRSAIPRVRARVLPIVIGLAPGVLVGTRLVSEIHPEWMKFGTFAVLLPLILLQAAGVRRAIKAERAVGLAFGGGVGLLYATTTISGPPLAVLLNNQGLAKSDFRAGMGLIRLAESSLTAIAYAYAGLYTAESLALVPAIVPGLVVGVPLGAWVIGRTHPETFRRLCISFDAWIVGFGLSTLLRGLHLVEGLAAYSVLAAVALIDAALLYRYFARPAARPAPRIDRVDPGIDAGPAGPGAGGERAAPLRGAL